MVNFFEEDKRVREACHYMEESYREAAAAMWEQANKIDKLKMENAKLKRENEQLKTGKVDMTKPQPCTKFRDAGVLAWIAKLVEETHEVVQEAAILEENADEDGTVDHDIYGLVDVKKRLIMELTDVITLCTSWIDALCYDEAKRGELQRRVNEKNCEQGYF